MSVAERLDGTEPIDVIQRHERRYTKAAEMAGVFGGTWWDVACGTGYGAALLNADHVIGWDRSPVALKQAKRHGVTVHQTDIGQPGWSSAEPAPPDVVVSIETLEHLTPLEQDTFVGEIGMRLEPGGVLVLACPIGRGRSTTNPWHEWEPSVAELLVLVERHLRVTDYHTESYNSTSGPAVQAFVRAVK